MLLKKFQSIRVVVVLVLSTLTIALSATERAKTARGSIAPPAPHVLKAAEQGLREFRNSRPYKDEWQILVDEKRGVVETNWYPEHKGEIRLRAIIAVWGDSFRVDVWQRVGWLFPSEEKTEWSRRTERHIQEAVQKSDRCRSSMSSCWDRNITRRCS